MFRISPNRNIWDPPAQRDPRKVLVSREYDSGDALIRLSDAIAAVENARAGAAADAGEAVASVDEATFKHLFYKHGGPVDSEGWCINESGLRDFLSDLAAVQGAQGGKGGEA
ncbi:hypothetical protein [Burkholderia glumae]|uniref:hypothetical protein n=1 Tax=Burkholderia glumae TaxID=337 RepID=UPI000F5D6B6A|nr:hypothetical protein [Burkholderia glumae]